jgi:hypothetical protein
MIIENPMITRDFDFMSACQEGVFHMLCFMSAVGYPKRGSLEAY